jgi:uncharacterized protein YndB with AHSA1/START domain
MSDNVIPLPGDWVRVMISTSAGRADMWQAVTETARLSRWFGTLRTPMVAGADNRVEFGDGDFFDIEVDRVEPGRRLAFRWSFLGVGPECLVSWQIDGDDQGSTLTVDDSCPGRPASETTQLKAGWLDFAGRLAEYLRTGRSTRYEWRPEIDGSVALPAGGWHPLRPETVADWLPVATDSTGPRWFFVVDEEGPRRFSLRDWQLDPGRFLTFAIEIPKGHSPTVCELRVQPAEHGRTLSIAHLGWDRLHLSDLQKRMLRHRFAATWQAALAQAEECARTRQELP